MKTLLLLLPVYVHLFIGTLTGQTIGVRTLALDKNASEFERYVNNPLFPASGPATRSFNGLHPKSKFLALGGVSGIAGHNAAMALLASN